MEELRNEMMDNLVEAPEEAVELASNVVSNGKVGNGGVKVAVIGSAVAITGTALYLLRGKIGKLIKANDAKTIEKLKKKGYVIYKADDEGVLTEVNVSDENESDEDE